MYQYSRVLLNHNLKSITTKPRRFNMSTQAIPVIVCGRTEQIGKPVVEGLKPEYDVVHFVPLDEDGVINIPRLLKGEEPINPASTIGSGNYSSVPVAIIFGGGYKDENINKFREAIKNAPDARKVPFLKTDLQKTKARDVEPGTPAYAAQVVERVKEKLGELKVEGKLDGSDDADHYF